MLPAHPPCPHITCGCYHRILTYNVQKNDYESKMIENKQKSTLNSQACKKKLHLFNGTGTRGGKWDVVGAFYIYFGLIFYHLYNLTDRFSSLLLGYMFILWIKSDTIVVPVCFQGLIDRLTIHQQTIIRLFYHHWKKNMAVSGLFFSEST